MLSEIYREDEKRDIMKLSVNLLTSSGGTFSNIFLNSTFLKALSKADTYSTTESVLTDSNKLYQALGYVPGVSVLKTLKDYHDKRQEGTRGDNYKMIRNLFGKIDQCGYKVEETPIDLSYAEDDIRRNSMGRANKDDLIDTVNDYESSNYLNRALIQLSDRKEGDFKSRSAY